MLGYSAEKALGQSLERFIPEKLRGRHEEGYHRVMTSGESKYKTGLCSSPAQRKDGSQVTLEFKHGAAEGC